MAPPSEQHNRTNETQPGRPATAELAERCCLYVANAPLPVLVLDDSGRFVEVNPATCSQSGYEEGELLRMSFFDIMAEESRDAAGKYFAVVKEAGHVNVDLCWLDKDGGRHWSACHAAALSPDRFIVYCLEITDLRQANDRLRQSEDRLKHILNAPSVAIGIGDGTGRITEVNDAFVQLLGYRREELLSGAVKWTDLTPPEYAERDHRCVVELESTGKFGPYAKENIRKDGTRVPILVGAARLPGPANEHVAFLLDLTAPKQAEEALRESNERFRVLVEQASDGFEVTDEQGRYLEVNTATCRQLGYTKEEMLGLSISDVDPRFPTERYLEAVQSLRGNPGTTFETVHRRKDGTEFPVEVATSVVEFRDGIKAMALVRDITERKWSEAILKAERDLARRLAATSRLRDIVELCLDAAIAISGLECGGIYTVDPDSGKMQIAIHRGLSRDFVEAVAAVPLGSALERIVAEGRWTEIPRHRMDEVGLAIAIREGLNVIAAIPVLFEQRPVACLNVASRTATATSSHARMALEAVAAQMGAAIARAQAEESLRQSERRQKAILDTIPDPAWLKDKEGRCLAMNPAGCRLLGRNLEEVLGKTDFDFLPKEAAERTWAHDCRAMQSGRPVQEEESFPGPDGEPLWFETVKAPLFNDRGDVVGTTGISRNITERKRAEQEKLEMERRLLHAQKLESIGILAGGIAHDFNNILAGIMGYADLARLRLPETAPARADLEVIQSAVRRAADLTRQMLAFSGKGRFLIEAVNLSQLVEDGKNMLAMSVSKKAVLKYQLAGDVPPIQADASQIHQVLLNLVINASDALGDEAGVIAVVTKAVHLTDADGVGRDGDGEGCAGLYVCLEVADTGCGMDRETLGKIFDPFFTTKFTGRGLGLAAVHGIVRGHKAAIRVVSEPGAGTTFQVFFPVTVEGEPESPDEVIAQPRRACPELNP